jgi:hypothetical protein
MALFPSKLNPMALNFFTRKAPAAPHLPSVVDSPPAIPSLAVLLQDEPPTREQKRTARRGLSRAICLVSANPEEIVYARVLTRRRKDTEMAKLLHEFLGLADSQQDKNDLKAAINECMHDKQFVKKFWSVAYNRHIFSDRYHQDRSSLINTARRMAADKRLSPVLDRIFTRKIEARLAAAPSEKIATILNEVPDGPLRCICETKLELLFRENAIKQHPFVRVFGECDSFFDDFLAKPCRNFQGDDCAEEVTALLAGLSVLASTQDKHRLKGTLLQRAHNLNQTRRSQLAALLAAVASSDKSPDQKSQVQAFANDDELAPLLDRILAGPIAARVAELHGDSPSGAQPPAMGGSIQDLVEARAQKQFEQQKIKARMRHHPLERIFGVMDALSSNSSILHKPILTSYGTPCAEQVTALLTALSQAATTEQDKADLKAAMAQCLSKDHRFIKRLADVAHHEIDPDISRYTDVAFNKVVDRILAEPIAACLAANRSGTAPTVGVGGPFEALVEARAKALAWSRVYQEEGTGSKRGVRIAYQISRLVGKREKLSAELRSAATSEERRQHVSQVLGTHEYFTSVRERQQVLAVLENIKASALNPHRICGDVFLNGWPLSRDATCALDQLILEVRHEVHVPVVPAPAPAPAPRPKPERSTAVQHMNRVIFVHRQGLVRRIFSALKTSMGMRRLGN